MARETDQGSPKRVAIMEAATSLFAARGYGAVSMDAIARAAEVSKATLYAHFESKDRLFATIVGTACRENMMPAGPDGTADTETALLAAAERILRFFLTERGLAIHRLVVAESGRFPELGQAFYDSGPVAGRRGLAAWLAGLKSLDLADPGLAAEQFIGLLRTGLYLRATIGLAPAPSDAEIAAQVRTSVSTFLRAFRAR